MRRTTPKCIFPIYGFLGPGPILLLNWKDCIERKKLMTCLQECVFYTIIQLCKKLSRCSAAAIPFVLPLFHHQLFQSTEFRRAHKDTQPIPQTTTTVCRLELSTSTFSTSSTSRCFFFQVTRHGLAHCCLLQVTKAFTGVHVYLRLQETHDERHFNARCEHTSL